MGGRAGFKSAAVRVVAAVRATLHGSCPEHIEGAKHCVVCEAQDCVALLYERGGTGGVARNLHIVRMGCAVRFHHEAGVNAGKVGNEVAENDLASKAEPLDLLAPQPLPKSAFRSRGAAL